MTLTLNFCCGTLGVVCPNHRTRKISMVQTVQNLSEIEQSAANTRKVLRMRRPNFTWRGHRAIICAHRVCFRFQISCCIFKRGPLKDEWCRKWGQISHFLTPTKIRGGMGEMSGSIIVVASSNLRNTFHRCPLCDCWERSSYWRLSRFLPSNF